MNSVTLPPLDRGDVLVELPDADTNALQVDVRVHERNHVFDRLDDLGVSVDQLAADVLDVNDQLGVSSVHARSVARASSVVAG